MVKNKHFKRDEFEHTRSTNSSVFTSNTNWYGKDTKLQGKNLLKNFMTMGLFIAIVFGSFQSFATTCLTADVIPAAPVMPYTAALTAGTTDDINGANVMATCGSDSYKGGWESVFVWTPTDSYINASIDYSGSSWSGIFLYEGCPTDPGAICLGSETSSASSKSLTGLTITAGTTYYIVLDTWPTPNSPAPGTITLDGTINVPCAGAPAPGNTMSSAATTCTAVSFDLSLQNATAGSGVSYVWESADDAAFTTNVQTLSSTTETQNIASQSADTYYRCSVTCGASTTMSTAVLVTNNPPLACYCVPSTSSGCTDGDVIAQVKLNTLDNNSGTGCPSGLAGYSDYTDSTQANYTTDIVAGNTYQCIVWAGQYSEGYAAWIDYNDDGVFDNVTERIGFTPGTVSGSSSAGVLGDSAIFSITLACNPPLGTHRLRVRAMYNTSGGSVTPCGSNSYGETEDYDITILAALACPAPSSLVVSNETDNSVDLTWNIGCSETAWNIIYGPTGFDPSLTGTSVAATMTSATVAGLTCETGYDFYVQADCGVTDGISLVSNVAVTSTTLCPCMGTPAPGNTESSIASGCLGSTVNLSLQNDVSGVGITYQWESADDAAFTVNVQTLGINDTETETLNGPTYYRCVITCAASGMIGTSTEVLVSVDPYLAGNDMAGAKVVPTLLCIDSAYVDTVNTAIGCYSDEIGNSSADVFYTFTLTETTDILASMCGSGFDTYVRILDNTGTQIAGSDDDCGTRSEITAVLTAGTYFVVGEGYSSNEGEIVMEISKNQICNACSFPMVLDNTVTTTSTTADVTWSTSTYSGTGWYVLEYKESSSLTWLSGGTANTNVTNKFFSGLTPNTSYDIRGRTVCSPSETGSWSPTVTFSTPILQDCALSPTLAASTTQGNFIIVTWAAVPTAGWYALRYRVSPLGTWMSAGTASGSTTSKTISGLTAGTAYDFEARTYCTNGIPSAWGGSVTVSTTALAGCELPPVLDPVAAGTSLVAITFSWPAVSGAGWYGFQYKESGSSTWISGGTAGGSATSKTRTGLMPATSYDFQARTYCPGGTSISAWSGTETYITDGAPAIVVNSNPDKATPDMADKSLTEAGQNTKVYPNPATDVVNVEINLENASENTTLRLMDMSGRVVRLVETQTNAGVNTITMDLQDLSIGMYTLLVYDNNSLLHTSKVKKN